jgi:hypothetical protein
MRAAISLLLAIISLAAVVFAAAAQAPVAYRIEYNGSVAGQNVRSYYRDLIQLVLSRTDEAFGPAQLQDVPGSSPQGRLLALLDYDKLDVLWTATSQQREKQALPIRIPLDMGLTGQRALVIRKHDVALFDSIRNLADLQRLKACQGAYWPDTNILRAAGLRVIEYDWIDLAYPATRRHECDYLPRSVTEIDGEVAALGGDDLMVYDRLILAYPMPMYLFVAHRNPGLAKRLQTGLEDLVADGGLRRFMEQHPATSPVFRQNRFQGVRVLRLENPSLPPETPLGDHRLWLDLTTLSPPA